MREETSSSKKKILVYLFACVILFAFSSNSVVLSAPKPTKTPTRTPTGTPTRTPSSTPSPITTATNTPVPTGTPFPCTSWNLASDFRIAPNQENPSRDLCNNLGVWAYMGSTGLIRGPANYFLMPNFTSAMAGVSGLNSWSSNSNEGHISFNATGTTYIDPGGWITWPANTIDVHPGYAQLVVMAWHSPVSGYVSVAGGVSDNNPYPYDCQNQDGIRWYIDKNSTGIAEGVYANGGAQNFAYGVNGSELNTVAVSVGDVIYLAISPDANYYCDDTRVDLLINVTSAPTQTPTPYIIPSNTPTLNPTSTPVACFFHDYEVRGVTGSNGSIPYYGIGGYSHVWDPTVNDSGVYVNSVWVMKDSSNLVELGWAKNGGNQGGGHEYFRAYLINGVPHTDEWGTPEINTDHEFKIYNVNADGEWVFYVDGNQIMPNVQIQDFSNGITAAMRERHTTCDSGWAHMWALKKYDSSGNWSLWETINEMNPWPDAEQDSLWFLNIFSSSEFFVTLH